MTKEELENNLGAIAQSGSLKFKEENQDQTNVNIIGQFKSLEVSSKIFNSDKAYIWKSEGEEGYEIKEIEKENYGTTIILYLKEDTEYINYSDYLQDYKIKSIIKNILRLYYISNYY